MTERTLGLEFLFVAEYESIYFGELARLLALRADNKGKYNFSDTLAAGQKLKESNGLTILTLGFVPRLYAKHFEYSGVMPPKPQVGCEEFNQTLLVVDNSFKLSFSKWNELGRPLTLDFEMAETYYLPKEEGR